jgi:hypothetical protein
VGVGCSVWWVFVGIVIFLWVMVVIMLIFGGGFLGGDRFMGKGGDRRSPVERGPPWSPLLLTCNLYFGLRAPGLRIAAVLSVLFECCPPCPPRSVPLGSLGGAAWSVSSLGRSADVNSAVGFKCLSGWDEFRGKRAYRCVPVVLGSRQLPFIPVYLLCSVFQASRADVLWAVISAVW